MKARLLDICLLAYPRARRERDRAYLRDLALDLSETYGVWRQAASLVWGGLGERIERRRRMGAVLSPRAKRLVAACSALAVVALAASSLIWPSAGEGGRVEVERSACVDKDRHSFRERERADGQGACAATERILAVRMRRGWDCETRRDARGDRRLVARRCSLG